MIISNNQEWTRTTVCPPSHIHTTTISGSHVSLRILPPNRCPSTADSRTAYGLGPESNYHKAKVHSLAAVWTPDSGTSQDRYQVGR